MAKSLEEIIAEILKDERRQRQELFKNNNKEMLDRDITFGMRDKICSENMCGLTGCPLFVDNTCIGNHTCKGIKLYIPLRYINKEDNSSKQESERK